MFSVRKSLIQRSGFTIIELLIVMAILTILSGILLPAFLRARESARQSFCLSNERQFALAFAQYVQDWDDCFPSGTTGDKGQGWAGQVYPYVKSTGLYQCPDDARKEDIPDKAFLISYAMNCNVKAMPLSCFSAPSLTVLLFEVNDAGAVMTGPETVSPTGRGLPMDNCPNCGKPFGADYYATGNLGSVSPRLSTTPRPYHDPTSNYLAADGHVKALRGENISPGSNALAPNTAQSARSLSAAGTESLIISPSVKAALTFSIR